MSDDVSLEWPVLPEGWKFAGTTEQVTWRAEFGGEPRREPRCDINWGSHGCGRARGHRGHHWCDPCEGHPWWLHAAAWWLNHRRWWPWPASSLCVERWPYYGRTTRFYGEDAP